jgi:hypothetical protein
MAGRGSLLLSCTKEEAEEMRVRAKAQNRTLSATILKVVLRGIDFDDRMFAEFKARALPPVEPRPGRKIAVHLRCSVAQARRIRAAARRRGATISRYVLYFLSAAWAVEKEREREREKEVVSKFRDVSDDARYGFLLTELDLASTFLQVAQSAGTEEKAVHRIQNARLAYLSAKRFLHRVPMTAAQRIILQKRIKRIEPLLAAAEKEG